VGGAAAPGRIRPQAVATYKACAGSFDNNGAGYPQNNQTRRNGLFYRDSKIRIRDILDGTSVVIAVGEVNWNVNTNARLYGAVNPNSGQTDGNTDRLMANTQWAMNPPLGTTGAAISRSFHSPHEGGGHFLFADGHVHFVSENIQHTTHLWDAANPVDRNNGGVSFGLYQRLGGRNDGHPVGEF
jgi:prepilin-type processing-associated H-X9-DG protein